MMDKRAKKRCKLNLNTCCFYVVTAWTMIQLPEASGYNFVTILSNISVNATVGEDINMAWSYFRDSGYVPNIVYITYGETINPGTGELYNKLIKATPDGTVYEEPDVKHYAGRVNVTWTGNNITLWIDDIKINDSTSYLIRLRYNNKFIQNMTSEAISVNVQDKVREKECDLQSMTVLEFTAVNYSCTVSGKPPPSIKWTKDKKIMFLNNITETVDNSVLPPEVTSAMKITSIKRESGGEYQVEIDNQVGTGITKNFWLNVTYIPSHVILKSNATNGEVKRGTTVALYCTADANPSANFTLNNNLEATNLDGFWTISNFTTTKAGKYFCNATNIHGSTMSNMIDLQEESTGCNSLKSPENETAKVGGSVLLIYAYTNGIEEPNEVHFTYGDTTNSTTLSNKLFQVTKDGQIFQEPSAQQFNEKVTLTWIDKKITMRIYNISKNEDTLLFMELKNNGKAMENMTSKIISVQVEEDTTSSKESENKILPDCKFWKALEIGLTALCCLLLLIIIILIILLCKRKRKDEDGTNGFDLKAPIILANGACGKDKSVQTSSSVYENAGYIGDATDPPDSSDSIYYTDKTQTTGNEAVKNGPKQAATNGSLPDSTPRGIQDSAF